MKSKGLAVLAFMLVGKTISFAQIVTGDRFIKEIESTITDTGPTIIRILDLVVLIGAAIWLTVILVNSNDKNSQHKNELVVCLTLVVSILFLLEVINIFL